ncbi:MAG: ABC transporter permease [Actinobacteria bacterium]|nr:ABC transporter permease [Actinomycetota bacterium]
MAVATNVSNAHAVMWAMCPGTVHQVKFMASSVAVTPPSVTFTHQRSLWQHRHLMVALAGRDLRARYRQSFLGLYWAVLNPLIQTVVMAFVFVTVMGVTSQRVPFVVLYFSGILYWSFFTNAVTGAMGSISAQVYLLEKHRFPIAVLPLASILARVVDFVLSLGVFALLLAWYGLPVPETIWLWLPMMALLLLPTIGLGLLAAALNTLYRDVSQIVGIVFTLGFFLTPIVYDADTVQAPYRWWLLLNPVAAAIHGSRRALFGPEPAPLEEFVPALLLGLAILGGGYLIFRRLQSTFTEVL